MESNYNEIEVMSLQIEDYEKKQLDLEEIKVVHVELIDKLEGKVKK